MSILALIKPKLLLVKNDSFGKKIKAFLYSALLLLLLILIWGIILKWIDAMYIKKCGHSLIEPFKTKQTNRFFGQNPYFNILKIIVLAPILEELAYRLPLNFKKQAITISSIVFCSIYVGDNILSLSLHSHGTWLKIIAILLAFLFGYFFIKQSFLDKIKSRFFNVFFYLLALLFAFDHISLYVKNLPTGWLAIAPLFVLPQFLLAIGTGYLRLKNGIIWAILLHMLFNAPTVLNYIFS